MQAVTQGECGLQGQELGQQLVPAMAIEARHQAAETVTHPRADDAVREPWQLTMELGTDQGAGTGGDDPAAVPPRQEGSRLPIQTGPGQAVLPYQGAPGQGIARG